MMQLPFNSQNQPVMNLLYRTLVTGRGYSTLEARVVNRIKKAFEKHASITKTTQDGQTIVSFAFNTEGSGYLLLENAEFDLLKSVFMGMSNWPGGSTEVVEQAEDYLNSIKEYRPEDAKTV